MNETQAATYARQRDYFTKHYESLKGYTVEHVEIMEERQFGYPQFWPRILFVNKETGDSIIVDVSCDEEGNEPGYLFISHYE